METNRFLFFFSSFVGFLFNIANAPFVNLKTHENK